MSEKDKTSPGHTKLYGSRKALLASGIHVERSTNLCLSPAGAVESWILDSETTYEDCGNRIVCLTHNSNFERNKQFKKNIRIVRSARSASLFAPERGYRYDGEYEVAEIRSVWTEEEGTTAQAILQQCQPPDPPPKAPYDKLFGLAQKYDFSMRVINGGPRPRIKAETPGRLSVLFEASEANTVFTYLYFRTTSWDADGERTDWHDVVSTLLAAFMRWRLNVSCSLWDQSNPFGLAVELYGRYITLDQPNGSVFLLTDEGLERIDLLLRATRLFGALFPSFLSWSHTPDEAQDEACNDHGEYRCDDDEVSLWKQRVSAAVRESATDNVAANFRRHPDWKYYRNLQKGLSVIEAPKTSAMFSILVKKMTTESMETIKTDRGDFLVSGNVKNFIGGASTKRARGLLTKLYPGATPCYLPTENMLITLTDTAILTVRHDCGLNAFNRAKLEIKPRHEAEARLLFPPSVFDWADPIDDELFECMILDLLIVEPGVIRARRSGSSRDSDQGRDLIIDWKTAPLGLRTERQPNEEEFLELRRVVGQCKASSGAIGKADVIDIRDTVAHHDSSGYFLATSLRITSDLASHLDALQARSHIWTEWWTRAEIEHRLRAHPEIAPRYEKILMPRKS